MLLQTAEVLRPLLFALLAARSANMQEFAELACENVRVAQDV